MYLHNITPFIFLGHFPVTAMAKSCSGTSGCVYYGVGDCAVKNQNGNILGDYVPTCGGNCFQFDHFDWVDVEGTGFTGVHCFVYQDINCQNQVGNTGNTLTSNCINTPGAQSMKCYFGC
jgi:hypothetical protein